MQKNEILLEETGGKMYTCEEYTSSTRGKTYPAKLPLLKVEGLCFVTDCVATSSTYTFVFQIDTESIPEAHPEAEGNRLCARGSDHIISAANSYGCQSISRQIIPGGSMTVILQPMKLTIPRTRTAKSRLRLRQSSTQVKCCM